MNEPAQKCRSAVFPNEVRAVIQVIGSGPDAKTPRGSPNDPSA
jgi:hypothetical protein